MKKDAVWRKVKHENQVAGQLKVNCERMKYLPLKIFVKPHLDVKRINLHNRATSKTCHELVFATYTTCGRLSSIMHISYLSSWCRFNTDVFVLETYKLKFVGVYCLILQTDT